MVGSYFNTQGFLLWYDETNFFWQSQAAVRLVLYIYYIGFFLIQLLQLLLQNVVVDSSPRHPPPDIPSLPLIRTHHYVLPVVLIPISDADNTVLSIISYFAGIPTKKSIPTYGYKFYFLFYLFLELWIF